MGEAELQRAIAGDVLVPGADGYESVRRPPIGRFDDVRPQAIVRCTTPADVAETIAFARGSGAHLADVLARDRVLLDVLPLISRTSFRGGAAPARGPS